jgi:uncharacterized protein (TIGR02246 family)
MQTDTSSDTAKIALLFHKWNDALQSGQAENVAALYAPDAILVPTFVNEILDTPSAIITYFNTLMPRQPSSKIITQNIRHFGPIAINSGLYDFSLATDGTETELQARFTFVYRQDPDGWKIIEHHSSILPQA